MSRHNKGQVFVQDLPPHLLKEVAERFADPSVRLVEGTIGSENWFQINRSEFDVFMENTGGSFEVKVPEGLGDDSKPTCPDHLEKMAYDPSIAAWICPQFACDKKARKRLKIDDAEGHIITGDLHLYSTGTGDSEKYYLYIRQLGVFIDVSSRASKESSGVVHGAEVFHLSLLFDELHNKD